MKRLLTLALVLVLLLCLTACGDKESGRKEDKEEQKEQQEQKQEQKQEEKKDTPVKEDAKEAEKQVEDENLAEEIRHFVEVVAFSEPEFYKKLADSIPDGEKGVDVIRIGKNRIEYCIDSPELEEWVAEIYGEEQLKKFLADGFNSAKYCEMEYTVTFQENQSEADSYEYEVIGTWKE